MTDLFLKFIFLKRSQSASGSSAPDRRCPRNVGFYFNSYQASLVPGREGFRRDDYRPDGADWSQYEGRPLAGRYAKLFAGAYMDAELAAVSNYNIISGMALRHHVNDTSSGPLRR